MKFSRVYHKKLFMCDKNLLNQFKRLNFGEKGMMRDLLDEARIFVDSYAFYVLDEYHRVAAWAICCRERENNNNIFIMNIYVKKKYRRKGLGKRIANYIKKYAPSLIKSSICVFPHDELSDRFFLKVLDEPSVFTLRYL